MTCVAESTQRWCVSLVTATEPSKRIGSWGFSFTRLREAVLATTMSTYKIVLRFTQLNYRFRLASVAFANPQALGARRPAASMVGHTGHL